MRCWDRAYKPRGSSDKPSHPGYGSGLRRLRRAGELRGPDCSVVTEVGRELPAHS